MTQENQYPLFDASPVSDDHWSPDSPPTSQGSSPVGSEWDAESFHSAGVSPATSASLSITNRTTALKILTPPLAPRPPVIQLNTDHSLLAQLATAYRDWLPQPPPDPVNIYLKGVLSQSHFKAWVCKVNESVPPEDYQMDQDFSSRKEVLYTINMGRSDQWHTTGQCLGIHPICPVHGAHLCR